jgi:hypothetical protein
MQTLWNHAAFSGIGFGPDHLVTYLTNLANWQKTGDVHFCDPRVPLKKKSQHDVAGHLKDYFANRTGDPRSSCGYITNMLEEAAGFRLRWAMGPYFLKIKPGKWAQDAPLPETGPNHFLFWYCCSQWAGTGGNLRLSPQDSDPVEIPYRGGQQAAMSYRMPHVLTAVAHTGEQAEPYYCLYGQLQEDGKDL